MGQTAIGLIFLPLGKRSEARMNPAVTLTFLRLGKMKPWDAFFYVVSQFVSGLTGGPCRGVFHWPSVRSSVR